MASEVLECSAWVFYRIFLLYSESAISFMEKCHKISFCVWQTQIKYHMSLKIASISLWGQHRGRYFPLQRLSLFILPTLKCLTWGVAVKVYQRTEVRRAVSIFILRIIHNSFVGTLYNVSALKNAFSLWA